MRNIASIVVFKTPFEDRDTFLVKWQKVLDMFEGYIANASIPLEREVKSRETFSIYTYLSQQLGIEVIYSIKSDLYRGDYLPSIILEYNLDIYKFEKSNIEAFLNDNIKFIFNVYFNDFFIDYHKDYKLDDYNRGKKLKIKDLEKFNLVDPKSLENKTILDNMMYLYYNTIKNIYNLKQNKENIYNIALNSDFAEFSTNLELFEKRSNNTLDALTKTAKKLKMQIDAFITLIS